MAIAVSQARKICTPSELELVLLSTAKQIGSLNAKQVKAKLNRTRTLQDKWRDLADQQTRTAKKDPLIELDDANARTVLKLQLFTETLERYSKRLALLEPVASTSSPAKSKIAKPQKGAKHRTQRADVRTVLADVKDQFNNVPSSSTTPGAIIKPVAPAPAAPEKKAAKKTATKKGTARSAKVSGTKTASSSRSPVTAASGAMAKPPAKPKKTTKKVSAKQNVSVQAAAKSSAFARGGVKSIRASVSAQGRRNQARRNTKG